MAQNNKNPFSHSASNGSVPSGALRFANGIPKNMKAQKLSTTLGRLTGKEGVTHRRIEDGIQ
ncbi:MAG: hypothetical protein KC584_06330, partial [Nitrospira sp.]|nr:hypothetical protein [Nitrospira sp.]